MPDDFEITIDTHEIDEMLASMNNKLAKGAVREALQAAGDVMLLPMKALCPERTTEIEGADNNSLQPGVLRESLTTQVQVGNIGFAPRVKVGAPIETNQVAWIIEEGFDQVKSKTHVAGVHYMAGAFDESADKAVEVLLLGLAKVIESDDAGGE